MTYLHVNPIAVLMATVMQWVLGWLWYGYVFRSRWMALVGISAGEKPANAWFGMVASFVANLVLSFILAHIIVWSAASSFPEGVFLGALCWLGFMAPAMITQHIFEKRPAKLFAINASYWLLAMMLSGGVLGELHIH